LAESIKSISVAGSPIKLQSSIKNLGVHLDSKMSFDKHVSEVCRTSYFHIRALRHIRSSLTTLGGIDGCLLVEPPALVLVFIYQARLNAIYIAKLS
jgi:hypothetical protein